MAIRIGFDMKPSNSGPGRYVGAITRALDPSEFEVVYLTGKDGLGPSSRPELGRSGAGEGGATSLRKSVRKLMPRSIRLWAGFGRTAADLASRLRGQHVDLLHVQRCGCEEWPLAGKLGGAKRVVGTFHVNPTVDVRGERQGIRYRVLEALSTHSLDKAIAVSEATRAMWLRRTGMPAARMVALHNGIDTDHFRRKIDAREAKAALGLPLDAIAIGGVGRLIAVKGFVHLVEAVAALRREFSNAHLLIAGEGPDRSELQKRAEDAGLAGRFHLPGWSSDVRRIYDALDVFVMPSLSEALPYALLEAMSHALPAVTSEVGGMPEVVVHGETGLLVPARDAPALAAALRLLIASEDLRDRLGAAARRHIVGHFKESDFVQNTIRVYRETLARR